MKNITFRTSLTGLSVLSRNAIVIIYSRDVLQPSGIRRFGNGVSQLSPLRPALGNGDPLIEFLRFPTGNSAEFPRKGNFLPIRRDFFDENLAVPL